MGQSRLFLCDEIQPSGSRFTLSSDGRNRKRKTHHCLFDMQPGDELMMKVALSTTSIDGAKRIWKQKFLPGILKE